MEVCAVTKEFTTINFTPAEIERIKLALLSSVDAPIAEKFITTIINGKRDCIARLKQAVDHPGTTEVFRIMCKEMLRLMESESDDTIIVN